MMEDIKSFGVQNHIKVNYGECSDDFNKLLTKVKSIDQTPLDIQKEPGKVETKMDGVEITGDYTNPNWIYIKRRVKEEGKHPEATYRVDHNYDTEYRLVNGNVLDVTYTETGLGPNWGKDGKPYIYHTSHTKYLVDLASQKLERTD